MEKLDEVYSSLINFTNRNIRRYSTEQLKLAPIKLTVDQWGVLKLLDEHEGEMTISELSNRMLKDKPTLTRIVDILVRDGLVTRTGDVVDRRRMVIRLTKSGRKKVSRASILVQALRQDVSRGVTKREKADLRRILAKINANIETARSRKPNRKSRVT